MTGHIDRRRPYTSIHASLFRLGWVLSVLLAIFPASCRAATRVEEESVLVEVRQVGFDHASNSPVVILQDVRKTKMMPIWVGPFEAQAISLELDGTSPPRPLTHDLMKNILEQVGVRFEKVIVSELKGSTYYARIHLTTAGKPFEVDSRPSDAIALALRFHRPIFSAKALFDAAFALPSPATRPEPASAKISGITVQNLTAELAEYFNVSHTQGVLVADVGEEIGNVDRLQRGDVILDVEGEPVHDIADLREKLKRGKSEPATLHVQRNGKPVTVQLALTRE
jgi:bifunctional DNase/RNase